MNATTQDPSLERLLRPECHLARMDIRQSRLELITLSRGECERATFIADIDKDPARARSYLDLPQARDLLRQSPPEAGRSINYIFHTAFCCSTLLSRAMDVAGKSFALREPMALADLASYKRHVKPEAANPKGWNELVEIGLRLLGKPFADGESVLIKPTNISNNLIEDVVGRDSTGGVLLLYSRLEKFLISVLKKGEHGRSWARTCFNTLSRNAEQTRDLSHRQLMRLTDLQIAALVWQLQIDEYQRVLHAFPHARIRTLDCDRLLADPPAVLARLSEFMNCGFDKGDIDQQVERHFRRHSKDAERAYDATERSEEYEKTASLHRSELDVILAWSAQLRSNAGGTLAVLPRPL